MRERAAPDLLAGVGAVGAGLSVTASVLAGRPEALLPIALAFAWWLVGLIATRARPDHASALLLLAVGAAHLAGFGLAAVAGIGAVGTDPWLGWALAAAGNLAYGLGFAALAALLVVFPDARSGGGRVRLGLLLLFASAGVLLPLTSALLVDRVDLALHLERSWVASPSPLPLLSGPDLSGSLPLLIVPGIVALIVRTLGSTGDQRRRLLWPLVPFGVLGLMLAATPAGTSLLGGGWAWVFVPIAAAVPLALLAGLQRYRLLEVELYGGRTLAYGVLITIVLSAFAVAEAVGARFGVGPAVGVTLLAALTAHPLRVACESFIDRWLTGGRVRGRAVVQQLAASLESADPSSIAARAMNTIRDGLDVAWVEVEYRGRRMGRTGAEGGGAPALTVPFVANGDEVGAIRCGPRRGGWSDDDAEILFLLARHTGLALYGAEVAAELADQVRELAASRARLVRAEDDVRRRIERDLHDGIQQQLVVLLARLELLCVAVEPGSAAGDAARDAHALARRSLSDLRNTVAGIHPALLSDRGVAAAIEAQADLLPQPVVLVVDPRVEAARFPAEIETAAYYVACEAATNVVKHAGATRVRIDLAVLADGRLQVAVVDDGRGFRDLAGGTGLRGLGDRVAAVGGNLVVDSVPGAGTRIVAQFPVTVVTDA